MTINYGMTFSCPRRPVCILPSSCHSIQALRSVRDFFGIVQLSCGDQSQERMDSGDVECTNKWVWGLNVIVLLTWT